MKRKYNYFELFAKGITKKVTNNVITSIIILTSIYPCWHGLDMSTAMHLDLCQLTHEVQHPKI